MPDLKTRFRSPRIALGLLLVMVAAGQLLTTSPQSAQAAGTFYVSTTGNDSTGTGSTSKPWKTIQKAADSIGNGSTVLIKPGTYRDEVYISIEATSGNPVVFRGDGAGVIVEAESMERDAVYIEASSYVTWENIRIQNAPRAGLRISVSDHITIRNNVFANNQRWGLFTDFSDDLLIEGNESFGATIEHGIYHSNSGDRPVIRGNVIHDNYANGLHMNGDIEQGGDGIITSAVVEGNYIYNNGEGGGSGINMDGVQSSMIRNNVIFNSHASGISMYQIDGGICSRNNKIYHNTIIVAEDGRWAVNIANEGCTGNKIISNILYSHHGFRGAINAVERSGFESDYNVLEGVFTTNGGDSILNFTQWKAMGYDTHSKIATPSQVFVNQNSDFHLKTGSPALNAGQTLASVKYDFDGVSRPQGTSSDAGAYERPASPDCVLSPSEGVVYTRVATVCSNFKSGELITVKWDGVEVETGSANSAGDATIRFDAPRSITGRHLVKATGDEGTVIPSRGFRIIPSIIPSPTGGTVGQSIAVTLRGYLAGEVISIRFRTAPGSSRTVASGIVASPTGTASSTFVVPSGDPGTFSIEGIGNQAGFASAVFRRILGTATEPTATNTATSSPTATATVTPSSTATATDTAIPPTETATETATAVPTVTSALELPSTETVTPEMESPTPVPSATELLPEVPTPTPTDETVTVESETPSATSEP